MSKLSFMLLGVLALLQVIYLPSVFAQCDENTYSWAAGAGDWAVPENWEHDEWDPGLEECVPAPGVPDSGNVAWVTNGGTATISSAASARNTYVQSSGVSMLGGSLATPEMQVDAGGWFLQDGGTNEITGSLALGDTPGSHGTYWLNDGSLFVSDEERVGFGGSGLFTQNGASNETWSLAIAAFPGSVGRYELLDGELTSHWGDVGRDGEGTFIQSGGTVAGYYWAVGVSDGCSGTYDLSQGELSLDNISIGECGSGQFTQSGGTHTLAGGVRIGLCAGADAQYVFSGGALSVGGTVSVGEDGIGSFQMTGAGGTINGTTGDARMIVNSSTGTLTGAGTFNITVTYESPKLYGANGDQGVDATFPPNGLTTGGLYDVTQLTPADFAGGTLPNLLPSSVFDVDFGGEPQGGFEIAIPYDESEVFELGGTEEALWVLRETGPEVCEAVNVVGIDPENNVVFACSTAFGKSAIGVVTMPFDVDGDGDVDLNDFGIQFPIMKLPYFAGFQAAFTGP